MPRFRNASLRAATLALLLLAVLCPAQQKDLTILHFNDLHAALMPDSSHHGGLAYLAAVIRREETNCASCVLLSAGDLVQGSPVSTIYRGMPLYDLANLLRIDASVPGNHEFDYGWKQALRFEHKAHFPIVCANVADDRGRLLGQKPFVILQRNGLRIGLIGVMTEEFAAITMPAARGPWHTLPLLEAIHKYAAELRPQTDVIVLLAHVTPEEEDRIQSEASEVAVVISGHKHLALERPKTSGGRVLVRADAFGRELGRLELKIDVAQKSVVSASWKHIPVDADSIAPAPDVARQVARWESKVAKVVDVPIGEARREIAGRELKELIERATCEEMHVDFSLMNLSGVRAALPAGRLLARHVWNVHPFDNRVLVGRFKGKDLPAAVRQGRNIDPEREYSLAVNDFIAANQPTELGGSGLQFPQAGPLQRDLLITWIKKQKAID